MTIPFSPSPEASTPDVGGSDGFVMGAAFSALNNRTEGNVKSQLAAQMQNDNTWSALWDVFFGFIKAPFEYLWAAMKRLFPFIPWQVIEDFDFWDSAGWVIDQLEQVPFVGDIVTWITGATSGTWETLQQWFGNVREFFAHINFFTDDFDLLAAAEDFIDFILFPVGRLASMAGLEQVASFIFGISSAITGFVGTSIEGTIATVTEWFENLKSFFAHINFLDPNFDLLAAAEDFIDFILFPVGKIADMLQLDEIWDWLTQFVSDLWNFPGQIIGSIGNVLMDGVASVGGFLSSLWGALTGQGGSGKTVANVATAAGGVASTAGTAFTNAQNALNSLGDLVWKLLNAPAQVLGSIGGAIIDGISSIGDFLTGLWNSLTGQSGSNKKVADVTTAAATVTSTTNTASTNASTALTNNQSTLDHLYDAFDGTTGATGKSPSAVRSRGSAVRSSAVTGEANSATALVNAATAQTTASTAGAVANAALTLGANLIPNSSFENTSILLSDSGTYSTDVARTGTRSMKLVGNGGNPLAYLFNNASGQYSVAAKPGDVYYFSMWVYGKPGNDETLAAGANRFGVAYLNAAGSIIGYSSASFGVSPAMNGVWTERWGYITLPSNSNIAQVKPYISLYLVANDTFYFDDVVFQQVTDAYAAKQSAAAAQADATTGITNAATAQTQANLGVTNAAAASTAAAAADTKAVAAQAAATEAQTAVDAAAALLDAAVTAGANLIPDPSFENPALDAARKATSGSVSGWWSAVTDVVKSGSRAMQIEMFNVTSAYPSLNLVPSLRPGWSNTPSIRIPCKPGQVFYMSQWVYLRSPNSGTREMGLYLATVNQANSIQYQFIQAFPPLDTWTKIEGYFVVNRSDVVSVAPLFGAFRPGQQLNAKAVVDDVVMIDVTDAYNAKVAADAAQATANTGVTNAQAAQTQANLGVTNAAAANTAAGAADLKAVAAQNAAATADTKAVAAQGFANNALKAGSNILPNGGFENTAFYTGNGVYDSSVKLSGSYSMKLTGSSVRINLTTGFQTADAFANSQPCRPLSTFYVEGWVYGDPANAGGGSINIYVDDYNAAGVLQPQQAVGMTATTALRGVWTKVYGTITVSANAASVYIFVYHGSTVPAGDKYFYDNFVAYEITEAQAAQLDADAAQASANTGIANAQAAQTTANTATTSAGTANTNLQTTWNELVNAFDGTTNATGKTPSSVRQRGAVVRSSAIAGEVNSATALTNAAQAAGAAATADGKAVTAQSTANAAVTKATYEAALAGGINMATNPSWEDTTQWMWGGSEYSTDYARTGTRSAKLVANGADRYVATSTTNTTLLYQNVTPGQVFFCEFWMYQTGGTTTNSGDYSTQLLVQFFNGATYLAGLGACNLGSSTTHNGVWTKVSGTFTVPAGTHTSMRTLIRMHNNTNIGTVRYYDDVVLKDVTEAYNAQLDADAAQADANTGITNAGIAQGAADAAAGAAATADGKAVAAQNSSDTLKSITSTAFTAGQNLCTNPGFENASFALNGGGTYSTEQAHSGTRSVKHVAPGGGYVTNSLIVDGTTGYYTPCSGGDKYAVEFWIYGKSTNVQTSGGANGLGVVFAVKNAAGTVIRYQAIFTTASTALNGVWTKVTGLIGIDLNAASFHPYLQTGLQVSAGETYYWDDVQIHRITEAQAAQLDADAAQADATTGITNAGIAQGAADAAAGAAATADAKAVTAKTLATTAIGAGPNLCNNGDFENTLLYRSDYTSTDVAYVGTRSLKLVALGGTELNIFAPVADDTTYRKLPCSPGDTFAVEYYVYGKTTNVQSAGVTEGVGLVLQVFNAAGTAFSYPRVRITSSTALNGVWTKCSGYLTIPAGGVSFAVYLSIAAAVAAGETYYFDGVSIREWTGTQSVIDNTVQAVAGGTATGYTLANLKTNVGAVNSQANLGVVNASTAQTAANTAQATVEAVAESGANMVISPNFENAAIARPTYSTSTNATYEYTTEDKYQGTRSFKWTVVGQTWNGPYLAPTGTNTVFAVKEGDTISVKTRVKAKSTNTANGSLVYLFLRWSSSAGGTSDTAVALADTFLAPSGGSGGNWAELNHLATCPAGRDRLQVFVLSNPTTPVGNSFYIDAVSVREETSAQTALTNASAANTAATNANTAAANAATAASNANTAAVNAAGAASAADTKALVAQNALASAISSGANLCANNGFENTDFKLWDVTNTSYSTEFKRSGSRSVKMVGVTGANIDVSFLSSTASGKLRLPVQAGDVLYFEAWVRGGTGNTKVGGGIRPYLLSGDPAAPTVSYPADISNYAGTLATLNAGWNKVSGYYTVPAGGVGLEVVFQLHTGAGTGCILHVDDMVCYRVTEGYVADGKAVAADSKAQGTIDNVVQGIAGGTSTGNSLATLKTNAFNVQATAADGVNKANAADTKAVTAQTVATTALKTGWNLVPNSSFEDSTIYLVGSGNSYSTAQARSGTRSLRLTGSGSPYSYLFGTTTAAYYLPCKPGDVFRYTYWVYGDGSNTVSETLRFGINCRTNTNANVAYSVHDTSAPTSFNNVWTQVTGTVTLSTNATVTQFDPYIQRLTTTGGTFYFDDVVLERITESNNAKVAADAAQGNVENTWNELVNAFDGTTGSTGKTAADVRSRGAVVRATANTAKNLVDTYSVSGLNLVSNPGFENSAFYLGDANHSYSTAVKRSGARSARVASTGGYIAFELFVNEETHFPKEVKPGDVYYVEWWMRADSGNTATTGNANYLQYAAYRSDNTAYSVYVGGGATNAGLNSLKTDWVKYSLYVTIPADAVKWRPYLVNYVPSGNTFYVDDVSIIRVTESVNINKALYGASANTPAANILEGAVPGLQASKITSGSFGSGQIADNAITNTKIVNDAVTAAKIGSNAVTDVKINANAVTTAKIADLAVSGAKTQGLDAGKITSGQMAQAQVSNLGTDLGNRVDYSAYLSFLSGGADNLCTNPSFEDTTQYLWSATANTNATYVRSGTRSACLTANGTYQYLGLTTNKTGEIYIQGGPNEKYYFEFYVKGDATNGSGTATAIAMGIWTMNSAKAGLSSVAAGQTSLDTIGTADWVKISGFITVPSQSATAFHRPIIFLPGTPAGKFYIDDVIFEKVTRTTDINSALYGPNVNIPGTQLLTAQIPTIDAGTKLSGTVSTNQLPTITNVKLGTDIDAAKLTAGTLPVDRIANAAITGAKIAGTTIGAGNIAANAVTDAKIATGAVLGDKIASSAVTDAKLAANAVTEAKIAGSAVTTAKIADAQITGLKIASSTIDAGTKLSGVVADAQIPTISNSKLGTDLDAGKLGAGTLPLGRITDNTLPGAKLLDGNIGGSKLAGGIDAGTKLTGVVADAQIPQLPQSKVDGLPADVTVNSTLVTHSQKIQTLESTLLAAESQGKLMSVNFANYPGTAAIPGNLTDFTVDYPLGTGTSEIKVIDGLARWKYGSIADRTARIVYTGNANENGKTLTNFQSLKGTLGSIPGLGSSTTNGPRFWAIARVSDDKNSYVWARAVVKGNSILNLKAEIGCTINGAETIWRTDIPLSWSLDLTFLAGANSNERAYQVYSGSTLVATYEEGFASLAAFPSPGTAGRLYVANDTGLRYTWNGSAYVSSASSASLLGDSTATSNYRRWGAITEVKVVNGTLRDGGAVAAATTSDNAISAYKGSVARMIRTSTTAVSFASGENVLPNSFFITNYETLDVDSDDISGTFTVAKSKMYMVTARIRLTASVQAVSSVNLQVRLAGSSTWNTVQRGVASWKEDAGWVFPGIPNGGVAGASLDGTWLQYLNVGDSIRLTTQRAGGSGNVLAGTTNGAETYFSIAGLT